MASKEYNARYYAEHREEILATQQTDEARAHRRATRKSAKPWAERTPEQRAANYEAQKRYLSKNPNKRMDWFLRRNYGISFDERQEIIERQGGKCAICGKLPSGTRYNAVLHVDHDHDTGKFRGMVCPSCNQGMGKFYHDPEALMNAAQYLAASKPLVAVA